MLATGAAKSVQRTYTFLARRAFGDPDALSTAADISRAARSENEGALARALVRAASLIGRFAREEGEDIVLRELVGEEEQQSGPPLLPDPAQFSRNPAQLLEQQSRRPPLLQ